ncbi:MAG: hypothetical protein WD355_02805 [Balneolaceae bacterium]
MNPDRTIQLQPSWKSQFWLLAGGVLLLPLLGIGLILLVRARRVVKSAVYLIRDKSISITSTSHPSREMVISDIKDVSVRQSWIGKKLDVGDIGIRQESGETSWLLGQENPHQLAGLIRHAARAEQMRLQQQEKRERRTPDYDPGSMERMEYLTGIWQQGLISDEEFRKEREHFE